MGSIGRRNEGKIKRPSKHVVEAWRRRMIERSESLSQIASEAGVASRTISTWFQYFGLDAEGSVVDLRKQYSESKRFDEVLCKIVDDRPDISDVKIAKCMTDLGIRSSKWMVRESRSRLGMPSYLARRKSAIRDLVENYPELTAEDIHDTLLADGYVLDITTVYDYITKIRAEK